MITININPETTKIYFQFDEDPIIDTFNGSYDMMDDMVTKLEITDHETIIIYFENDKPFEYEIQWTKILIIQEETLPITYVLNGEQLI